MLKQSLLLAGAMALSFATVSPVIAQASDTSLSSLESSEYILANRFEDNFKKNQGELLSKLDLSSTQKQQIQAIREQYRPQMTNLMSEIRAAQEEMKSLAQSNASRSQLESQYNANSSLRNEMADLKFAQMMDIRDILTVSQRQEMVDFIAGKQKQRGGFFGNR
ncbi:hypothetical protein Lepto7376_4021 [[Leptolyngbya] sp. PCC 7376]|uniref:Spy/CpxP family protein refolding chaperone n=1 Tax=[Leptolyngbya] sp. PCC 7376 TaxID=111781 RepID=UPI00029EDAD1|nr:Spy/CpxP family protein refolding chaperone [[Leptolyngbya] sp. PCC 7376]AFY40158.1 hypothetical protein Lepto7376_4021 [[Leptolyngbya] sp. PCC 7376]